MPLILRIRLWLLARRIAILREEAAYHHSVALSQLDEADQLQRLHLMARMQDLAVQLGLAT